MVWFAARCGINLILMFAGVLAALSVAAAPHATAAENAFAPVAKEEQQRRIIERIDEAQSRDGPFSPELIEPLTELFDLNREGGDPELAAAARERALQVVRANTGLFSLDQIPLLRHSLATEDSRGNVARIEGLERELWNLARRNPGDLRTVPVLRELGDRRLALRKRLLAGELPDPIRIGGDLDERDPAFGSRSARAHVMTAEAWAFYAEAIRRLRRHEDYTSDELRELEMALVRISYLYNKDYAAGRSSLLRQVSYDVARDEPLVTRVNSLIRVADWDLTFNQNGTALETYDQVYTLLRDKRAPTEAIDAIFSPKVPVVLPTFLPNPIDTEEAGSAGYIDVAFEIHKYGSARDVAVLHATPNVTATDKDALTSVIYRSRFRPRIVDGEFGHRSRVVLRYYLHAGHANSD